MRLGWTELLVIFGILLLLFGNRLPGVGKALGEGLRNFKKGLNNNEDGEANANTEGQPPAQQSSLPAGQTTSQSQAEKSQARVP